MVDGVNGRQKQLLLEMRQLDEILLVSVCLDRWIFSDNASARARRIEKYSVKTTDDTREFTSVVVANNDILNC